MGSRLAIASFLFVSVVSAADVRVLSNGLSVVAVPFPTTSQQTEALLRFETGWADDPVLAPGAARLLACAFVGPEGVPNGFRSEHDVEAHIEVKRKETWIWLRAPIVKGPWMFNELAHRVFAPESASPVADKATLEHCSQEVHYAGRPWRRSLEERFWAGLHPLRWVRPGFLTTAFGISPEPVPSTVRTDVLVHHREEFFIPGRATLFYGGAFKAERIATFVAETFGAVAGAKTERATPTPLGAARGSYRRITLAKDTPALEWGTHFSAQEPADVVAADLYFRYLAGRFEGIAGHRIATPEARIELEPERVGIATIAFSTSRENFHASETALRRLVAEERAGAPFEEDLFREVRATRLREASPLERAHTQWRSNYFFGDDSDPEELAKAMTGEEARTRALALWNDGGDYVIAEAPPLFFSWEWMLLAWAAATTAIHLCRRVLLRPFEHRSLRYMRRIQYQPAVVFFLLSAAVAMLYAYRWVFRWLDRATLLVPWLQGNLWTGAYLPFVLYVGGATACVLLLLSRLPRKILVTNEGLVLKSFTYYARTYTLDMIDEVGNCRFSELLRRERFRDLRLYSWMPFRRGLLLRLKGGGTVFVGVADARTVHRELHGLLMALRKREAERLRKAAADDLGFREIA